MMNLSIKSKKRRDIHSSQEQSRSTDVIVYMYIYMRQREREIRDIYGTGLASLTQTAWDKKCFKFFQIWKYLHHTNWASRIQKSEIWNVPMRTSLEHHFGAQKVSDLEAFWAWGLRVPSLWMWCLSLLQAMGRGT